MSYLKKKIKDLLLCETPISIANKIGELLSVKHGLFFVQDNLRCECEKKPPSGNCQFNFPFNA